MKSPLNSDSPFRTVLRDASLVGGPNALRFRLRLRLGDVIIQAAVQAAGFCLVVLPVVFSLAWNEYGPAMTLGEAFLTLLFSPVMVSFLVIPFLPFALLRCTRCYGQSNPLSLGYGSIFGVVFLAVQYALQALSTTFGGAFNGPLPYLSFLILTVVATAAAAECVLWCTEPSAA